MDDLQGKKISIGEEESGTEQNANLILTGRWQSSDWRREKAWTSYQYVSVSGISADHCDWYRNHRFKASVYDRNDIPDLYWCDDRSGVYPQYRGIFRKIYNWLRCGSSFLWCMRFGMGATPNAMANMQVICEKYAPSVKAYLLVVIFNTWFFYVM